MSAPEQRDPVEVLRQRLELADAVLGDTAPRTDDVVCDLADALLAIEKAIRPTADPAVRAVARELVGTGTDGAALIAAERDRQIRAEGWTAEHDDQHAAGELAWAAACYAAPETVFRRWDAPDVVTFAEPWPRAYVQNANRGQSGYLPWRRPESDRITKLVRAGGLIAAEIDRLQRQVMDTEGSEPRG